MVIKTITMPMLVNLEDNDKKIKSTISLKIKNFFYDRKIKIVHWDIPSEPNIELLKLDNMLDLPKRSPNLAIANIKVEITED